MTFPRGHAALAALVLAVSLAGQRWWLAGDRDRRAQIVENERRIASARVALGEGAGDDRAAHAASALRGTTLDLSAPAAGALFVREISRLARRHHLHVASIGVAHAEAAAADDETRGLPIAVTPLEVRLEGAYADLAAATADIRSLRVVGRTQLVALERVRTAAGAHDVAATVRFDLEVLRADAAAVSS